MYCEDSTVVATLKMGKEDPAKQCGWSLDVGKNKKLNYFLEPSGKV